MLFRALHHISFQQVGKSKRELSHSGCSAFLLENHYLYFRNELFTMYYIRNLQHMSPSLNSRITTTSLSTCYSRCLRMNSSSLVVRLGCLQGIPTSAPFVFKTQGSVLPVARKQELEAFLNQHPQKPVSALPALFPFMFPSWKSVCPVSANQWEKTTFGFGLPTNTSQWCIRNYICNCSLQSLLHYCNLPTTCEFPVFTTFALRVLPLASPSQLI